MRRIILAAVLVCGGCAQRTFTDLGNGTAVPTESVTRYAQENGLSREQARLAMLAEDQTPSSDKQNERNAAKSALTDAVSRHAQAKAHYEAGAVSGTDVGKAALSVEQAKLKLAVLERGAGDAVATMKRIVSLEQDQEKVIRQRFAAGAVTGLDLVDAQIELAEQQLQMERANVANLRQQQLELAQQHAKAAVMTESDLTPYRTRTERAWEELKSHIPE